MGLFSKKQQPQSIASSMKSYQDYMQQMMDLQRKKYEAMALGKFGDEWSHFTAPKPPTPTLLHRIGAVSVWKDPNGRDYSLMAAYMYGLGAPGNGGEFVARLKVKGGEHEWRGKSPREALRGLRRFCPKTYGKKGEIVGRRCWKLSGGYLAPITDCGPVTVFKGPILEAHEIPTFLNQTGLYAVRPDEKGAWVRDEYAHDAYGDVGCYGRVIEHETGFRAQYQVIRSITLLGEYPEWFVKGIADTYQCDVMVEARPPKAIAENVFVNWSGAYTGLGALRPGSIIKAANPYKSYFLP